MLGGHPRLSNDCDVQDDIKTTTALPAAGGTSSTSKTKHLRLKNLVQGTTLTRNEVGQSLGGG